MSYSTARASANESWGVLYGAAKIRRIPSGEPDVLCWLEEAIARRVVTSLPKARFSFQEARSAWGKLRLDRPPVVWPSMV
ncbi:hypothetical protein [Escherichia coli]|uniref:hypothetical protein n=1 Tax=Escherichia coli TaxID=562 RepID=UPI0039A6AE32